MLYEALKFCNLKLRLAVTFVFVPSEGCTHQVIEAGVPEVRHDVMAPPKCVQRILLHGGLNLEVDFYKGGINTYKHKHTNVHTFTYDCKNIKDRKTVMKRYRQGV